MEGNKDISKLLELIPRPAFCVRDGKIFQQNESASQLLLEPGRPICELLREDAQEYAQFRDGSLYLTLWHDDRRVRASVTRLEDADLFTIENDQDPLELRTMALTAMQLREPLSAVNAILQRAIPAIQHSGDETADRFLSELDRRMFQLQRMICNMSDAARYTTEAHPRLSCVDICAVVEEQLTRIEGMAAIGQIQLLWSCPREKILMLLDTEKLARAIYNMISNAIKASPKGAQIEVDLVRRNARMYLSVRDYGSGIPDHTLGTVFSRYRRAPGLEDSRNGLGLGLPLICAAASAHDGTVLIERPQDGGTRITMSLSIRDRIGGDALLRSNTLRIDYAGEQDHALLALSDVLPADAYR